MGGCCSRCCCCRGCCRTNPRQRDEIEGLLNYPGVLEHRLAGSLTSSVSTTRSIHGRGAYKFNPPTFTYNMEPEHLISFFEGDSFQSADSLVDLFKQAKECCKEVNKCLNNCTRQLNLPNDANLSACIDKIMRQCARVEVGIVDTQPDCGRPPQLAFPQQQNIPQNVEIAGNQLNEALRLAFEFANDEKHRTLGKDKDAVRSFQNETQDFQEHVPELLKYAEFSASAKEQAEFFMSDFVECYNQQIH